MFSKRKQLFKLIEQQQIWTVMLVDDVQSYYQNGERNGSKVTLNMTDEAVGTRLAAQLLGFS